MNTGHLQIISKHIISLLPVMLFLSLQVLGQDKVKAFFEHKIDTVQSDAKKDASVTFKVIVPKQDKFKDAKVEIFVAESDMSPSNVYLPNDPTITIGSSADTIKKDFNFKFQRSDKDDRVLTLKLNAKDKDGKDLSLSDSNIIYKAYIKPLISDTLSDASQKGHEFWLFTGTNLDLLDGVKMKELYFKGTYLFNFKNDKQTTRSWVYLTFGKNRYFSDRDSLSRIPFKDMVLKATPGDSITIANGYYNSFRQTVTDNIFASFDYLYNIRELSAKNSKLFLNLGFYFGLQTLKTSYNNHDILSDTTTYLRKVDSSYIFRPLLGDSKVRQFNYNISFGFTHILSTEKLNIKTQLTAGLNIFNYPYSIVRNSTNEYSFYETKKQLFTQLRIDGTVLNAGLSIGFETFIRRGEIPLFNVSLTKVIDIEQLSSLFGKLPTATN